MTYDDAAAALYQVPHDEFVAERKRLAADLKATDKAGAAKLAKLTRPPISAWTVNQLWWHARSAFDELLETGEQLRAGKLAVMPAHREAVAKLRAQAQSILTEAGNAANEATLRRITTTLAAIAATGGFDPDAPGMLSADRDPPGFEAAGIPMVAPDAEDERPATPVTDDELATAREKKRAAAAKQRDAEAAAEQGRAAAERDRRKAEQERTRRLQERHRLEAALRTAVGDVERREREVARLGAALADAEAAVEKARAIANDLESQLAALDS